MTKATEELVKFCKLLLTHGGLYKADLERAIAAVEAEGQPPADHLKHVQVWLLEMYQTMIDPVEEFEGNIEQLCAALLKQALEDREALEKLHRATPQPETSLRRFTGEELAIQYYNHCAESFDSLADHINSQLSADWQQGYRAGLKAAAKHVWSFGVDNKNLPAKALYEALAGNIRALPVPDAPPQMPPEIFNMKPDGCFAETMCCRKDNPCAKHRDTPMSDVPVRDGKKKEHNG